MPTEKSHNGCLALTPLTVPVQGLLWCVELQHVMLLLQVVSVEERQPASGGPTAMDVLGLRTNRPLNMEEYPIRRSVSELMSFKVTPEDHRNYALTWYTLSAATGAMAFGILRKRRS